MLKWFAVFVLTVLFASASGMPQVEEGGRHWLEANGIVPGSPAEAVGIRPGDVLATYNGNQITTLRELAAAKEAVATDSVSVVFKRNGEELKVRMPKGQLGIYFSEWRMDIQPDQEAKVIFGIERLGWDTGKENTFMGALEAVVKQQGVNADYTFLCGVSGAAFRLHFFDTWCPSSPDPGCGFDATKPAFAACGFKARSYELSPDGKNKPQILKAVKQSIDAGVPVLGINLIETPEWGVIAGYQKQGEELFCRTYFDTRKNYDLADFAYKPPVWAVIIPVKSGKPPKPEESYRGSFRIVSENLTTEKYGQYYSGLAAFDKWIERIRTGDFATMDSEQIAGVIMANYWIYHRLVSDRKTGLDYLERLTGEMPNYAPQFDSLIALYSQEIALLEPLLEEFPYPGGVTKGEEWTQEAKEKEIAALMSARRLEEQTLPLWQKLTKAK